MKNIAKFLLTLAIAIVSLSVCADDSTEIKPVNSTKLKKSVANTQSPRTLGDMFITCYYNNECIEVEFPAEVDCMDVSISDGATIIWSGFVTADTPVCDIPYLVGVYNIVCTTDNGAVYQGMLSL